MMQSLMNMFLLMSTLIFSQLKHPLAMGFLLLIQTTLMCLFTGMMFESFWFSYILFLVFLGGMLVLFIYVISLASNEMFNFSFKLMMYFIAYMNMIMITMLLLIDFMDFSFINNSEMLNSFYNLMLKETFHSIYKLYNFPTNWITFLLINYLLFTLIVVVKITNLFYGPIRNIN